MNILDRLIPSLHPDESNETAEEKLARERVENIKFHRAKVRNGPVSFTRLTRGQVRRIEQRELASRMKKTRRSQVRTFHRRLTEEATLRGHLQTVGIIDYGSDYLPTVAQVEASLVWFAKNFAPQKADPTVEDVEAAVEAGRRRHQELVASLEGK